MVLAQHKKEQDAAHVASVSQAAGWGLAIGILILVSNKQEE